MADGSHDDSTRSTDIAVVGMSCRFPHAVDLPALWRLISSGEVTFEDISQQQRWTHSSFFEPTDVRAPDKTYVRKGAFIDGVDEFAALHYGLAPRRVQVMDPQQRLAIEMTRQALADAGYDTKAFDRARTGVFIGASVSEYKDVMGARHRAQQMVDGDFGDALSADEATSLKASVADVVPIRAFSIPGSLLNMIACSVSQTFDLNGPAMQIDAACSSALVAIHEAAVNLRARQCNLAIAGGVYLNLHPDNLVGFSRIGAVSLCGVCRPFDERADGFVMGEGIGLVVLKRYDDAVRDGDRIYAVMRGSGCNNDGRGEGPMTPRPEGQIEAMRRAHAELQLPIESIGYVETHGTATTVGDATEVGALKQFFAEKAGHALHEPFAYLGSIKANIGHTMSAAGVAGFIKTCLMLHHRVIPPQPGCESVNSKLDLGRSPFRITDQAREWVRPARFPRRAAVSSFGFGGTNAHVIIEEAPRSEEVPAQQEELFLLSAATPQLLISYAKTLADEIEARSLRPVDVALTLSTRAVFATRATFVAKGREALVAALRSVTPVTVSEGAAAPKLAFLFPGQGAQKVNLLKELVDRFPSIRARLEQYERAAGISMLEVLYPSSGADLAAAQAQLTRTEICQPVMAALGLSLYAFLEQLNVVPHVVLGHSLGEFAAAAVADMMTPEQAVRLVAARGQLMNELTLGDTGAMLAVRAERSTVEQLLSSGPDGVWLANHNHPTQVVLSGTTPGIAQAELKLNAAQLKSTRLEVSHAFHSPLLGGIDAGMKGLVDALEVREPKLPVISCIEGRPYVSAAEAREVWVRHATAAVQFVEALEACLRAGVTDFVQVGAGGALLSFARALKKDARCWSTASSESDDGGGQLLSTLGQLWLEGVPLNARPLFEGSTARLAMLSPTPLETQKYWAIERSARARHVPLTRVAAAASSSVFSVVGSQTKGVPMDSLIALFQQQNSLLQSQADILKAQSAAIVALAGGQPMPALASAAAMSAAVATPVVTAAPPAVKAPNFSNLVTPKSEAPVAVEPEKVTHDLRPAVQEKVLASLSRISAFPVKTLKLDATLVGELGFDSLMLVELDHDIGKAFPSLGGLPRELFSKTTTATTVIDHVVNTLTQEPAAVAEVPPAASAPLDRYVPTVVAAPLLSLTEAVTRLAAPVLVTRDSHGIADALVLKLAEQGVGAKIGDVHSPGPFAGVIHLADVTARGDYRAPTRNLLELAKKLTADTAEVFMTVTGLGGGFGMHAATDAQTLGQVGALGFTRALSQEWADAVVKAIDVDLSLNAQVLAQSLVDELISGDRTNEVGLTSEGRVTVSLASAPNAQGTPIAADQVVLITGGAKGLGLKFAKALAKQAKCTIVLTGRSPADVTGDVLAAGAKACSFHVMNVRDPGSVKAAVQEIRAKYGRIDVVVHNAGVLADALVAKKAEASLDAVLETKVGGALALLDAVPEMKRLVGIGSWAGRFGNAAQTDYSAANAMLARLGHATVDFPPFEESDMVAKIPAFRKAELKAAGVTFVSDDEGVSAFLRELTGEAGEVLVGRELPERVVKHVGSFPVSRLNHVYLNDHTMAGQRVLPFAAALDHVTAAALESIGAKGFTPFTVSNFALKRAVLVPDTTWLEVTTSNSLRPTGTQTVEVTLSQGQAPSYQGVVSLGASPVVPTLKPLVAAGELPMPLADFYSGFTFHGPRLQGITRIEAVSEQGIVGWVKASRPSEWIKEPLRSEWTVDPLIIDASFQLAGYWAWVKQQRAGFPLSLATFVQLKPFGQGPVKCTVNFETSSDDLFSGTLVWHDAKGDVLAYMTGTKAEFKKRDPQFGLKPSETVAAAATGPVPDEATWNPAKFPEYEELQERLQMAEAFGLRNPYFSVHEAICGDTTVVNGQEMINFSSYNYVGNSGNPVVSKAAQDAIAKYGTSVSASRVASGEKPLTRELEVALSDFFGTEDCIVMVSGHATNVSVIGHLVGAGDLIVHDALAHDSIIQGAKLSGAKRRPFPHNDWGALDRMLTHLRPHYRRVLVCIEGTYSMDGDIPDLPKFIEVKKKHHSMLLVDEAHSAGVVGKTGRGIGEYFNVDRADVDLWGGTLSKSFASCGGYIAGSKALVEYLKYTTPGFVYSVGISPPNAAAALASTREMLAHPERVTQCQENAKTFLELLHTRGINTGMSKDSAVVPAIVGNSVLCLQLSDALKTRGINVQPILYPAVEDDQARLRFFLSSMHKREQLVKTADILKEELDRLTREMNADAVA